MRREQVPGVGIALVDREGVIWAGGVGVADRQTGAPVTADTVFRVASISKSVVGLGVARLVAQGRLSLAAPLARTLPELAIDSAWEGEVPLTLAHVLEHTAGFDDMRFNEWFADDDAMTPAQALAINPRARRVRWRPGSRMSYSNEGTTVAALAIERATGRPFDAWLHDEVLAPLGMPDAAFGRTPDRKARLAKGYVAPDREASTLPIAHRAAGGLLVSPRELARLVHYWVPPALRRRMHGQGDRADQGVADGRRISSIGARRWALPSSSGRPRRPPPTSRAFFPSLVGPLRGPWALTPGRARR